MGLIAKKELLVFFAKNGYSVQTIAEWTGLAKPTVYRILKKKEVRPSTAKQVCDVFQIEMMQYFELSD